MRTRILGKTNVSVSEIGLGTWGMGSMWGPRDDEAARASIRLALERGVTFIDTAYVYGNGHSERLIGQVLAELGRRDVFVATKVPPKNFKWPAQDTIPVQAVFPPEWIVEMTEKSLGFLGAERVDLQQLHVWSNHWLKDLSWLEGIQRLKTQGKIRFFGVSLNDHAPNSGVELVKSGLVDTVQVIYNIFDQSPEDELLSLCREHNVGVIARVPFDEGSLSGTLTPQTVFVKGDWRREYFKGDRLAETCKRVEALRQDTVRPDRTLPQLALQYGLANPAVSTVIPGMRKPAHVEENTLASDLPGLTADEIKTLKRHRWTRNFYPVY